MRVALLLSGKFRNSYVPFYYLEKNLLSKYNPDVFIDYSYIDSDDIECDKSDLINLYNPKFISFEQTPSFVNESIQMVSDCEVAIESNTSTIFNMWWGIYKVNELKRKYEEDNGFKYDIVIRTRFDIEVLEEVHLRNWNDNVFIPIGSDHRDGINDFLAYGASHSMDYYCSTFKHLVKYIKDGEIIHPERLLRKHLSNYNDCLYIRTHIPLRLRGKVVTETDYSITP